ncbi:MAG: SAM-dependent methyltransferase, partial [Actinomycetota bacterium]|nr:SAM-dependent methyltransferase [Actinomycetota bacterium]
ITAPRERERAFLQRDHVRLYTPDIAGRLEAAGFAVEVIDTYAELGPAAARHGLRPADLAFVCRA